MLGRPATSDRSTLEYIMKTFYTAHARPKSIFKNQTLQLLLKLLSKIAGVVENNRHFCTLKFILAYVDFSEVWGSRSEVDRVAPEQQIVV